MHGGKQHADGVVLINIQSSRALSTLCNNHGNVFRRMF